jgi:hypothetical protein
MIHTTGYPFVADPLTLISKQVLMKHGIQLYQVKTLLFVSVENTLMVYYVSKPYWPTTTCYSHGE